MTKTTKTVMERFRNAILSLSVIALLDDSPFTDQVRKIYTELDECYGEIMKEDDTRAENTRLREAIQEYCAPCEVPSDYNPLTGTCVVCLTRGLCKALKGKRHSKVTVSPDLCGKNIQENSLKGLTCMQMIRSVRWI